MDPITHSAEFEFLPGIFLSELRWEPECLSVRELLELPYLLYNAGGVARSE